MCYMVNWILYKLQNWKTLTAATLFVALKSLILSSFFFLSVPPSFLSSLNSILRSTSQIHSRYRSQIDLNYLLRGFPSLTNRSLPHSRFSTLFMHPSFLHPIIVPSSGSSIKEDPSVLPYP